MIGPSVDEAAVMQVAALVVEALVQKLLLLLDRLEVDLSDQVAPVVLPSISKRCCSNFRSAARGFG